MAANLTKDLELSEGYGYNKIFRHQWNCAPKHGLSMGAIVELKNLCFKKFGWHFVPHRNMNYAEDDWYKNQTLILTFESKWDMVHAKLRVTP
tara:strand:+ start:232 stop:507 length:276 start_codon:yes stop_codon:yes gene_type:complete